MLPGSVGTGLRNRFASHASRLQNVKSKKPDVLSGLLTLRPATRLRASAAAAAIREPGWIRCAAVAVEIGLSRSVYLKIAIALGNVQYSLIQASLLLIVWCLYKP